MYPLGDKGCLCIAQHGSFNWEKPGLHSFLNVPCTVYTMRGQITVGIMEAFRFRSTGARQHVETLYGIDPRSYHQSSGTMPSTARHF